MRRRNHRNRWELTVIRNIRQIWPRFVAGLAAFAVFCTVYSMILPASAITGEEASQEAGFFLDDPESGTGGSEENSRATEITAESPQEVKSTDEVTEGPPEGWETIPEAELQTVSEEAAPVTGEGEAAGDDGSITEPSEDQQTVTEDAGSGDGAGTETTDINSGNSDGTEGGDVTGENFGKDAGTDEEESIVNEETAVEETADAEELADEELEEELEEEEETEEEEITFSSGKLFFRGNNYSVTIEYDADAKIPDTAELRVRELEEDSEEYKAHYETAKSNAKENGTQVRTARFFDITIMASEKAEGTDAEPVWREIEPAAPVKVNIAFDKEQLELPEKTEVEVLHFEDENNAETVEKEKVEVETAEGGDGTAVSGVGFDAAEFSVFGVVGTQTVTVDFLTADGETLKVTVTFDEKEVIPEGAELSIEEIQEGEEGWIDRSLRLGEVLEEKFGYVVVSDARFLNISVLVNGEEFEPLNPVEIKIEYEDEFDTDYTYDYANKELTPEEVELGEKHFVVVHYADEREILESEIKEGEGCIAESVSRTTSFSEYDVAYLTEDKILEEQQGVIPSLEIAGKSTSGISTSDKTGTLGAIKALRGAPAHSKILDNNGDGTYEIHLNVTGEANTVTEASNVNVVIVYDTSTSMNNSHDYGPYYVYTPNATGRYGIDGSGNYFNLYYRSGNNYRQLTNDTYTGTVYSNNRGTVYNGNRYIRTTRADVAEPVVRSFVNSLYSYQNPDDPTNIQTTFITFNGSATPRTNWTTSPGDITRYLVADGTNNSYNHTSGFYASGTNWELALRAVETALTNKPDNDPTYVVFITDGAPTTSARITTAGTQYEQCYIDARDEALRIQNAVNESEGDFYSIYAYGDETDWLATMMYYANNGREPSSGRGTTFNTKGYYNAADTSALSTAISEIFEAIVDTLGITSVSIEDGTTSEVELTTGGGATADLLDVDTDSFKYTLSWNVLGSGGTYTFKMPDKVSGEDVDYTVTVSGENVTITWNGGSATYKGKVELNTLTVEWVTATDFYRFAPPAAQFVDPDVKWNLGSLGTLLNGVTYDVAFECYPTQYTLDLIADLKNEYIAYDSLDANIKKYLLKSGNDFELKTNTGAKLKYTDTRTEDGPQESEYSNPDPQSTAATKTVAVSKDWSNVIDDREKPESLTMHVTRDGEDRYELELNDDNIWSDSAFISYGIMTIHEDGIHLKTTGHDYSFSEPNDMEYYWELQVPTLRPMLINTVETMLVKVDESEAPAMSGENATAVGEDGYTYYKLTIGGTAEYYKVDEEVAHLRAENHRRSYLDVVKTVTGTSIPEGDVFPFTMTVTNSHAAIGTEGDLDSDYWVWFSVADSNNEYATVIAEDIVTGDNVHRATDSTGAYTGYYYMKSGSSVTVNMQNGYSLRFLNLPTESTYTIAEDAIGADSSYSFVNIKKTRSYKESKDGPWIIDEDYTETITDSQSISGAIGLADSAYKVEVTNKCTTVDIQLKKVKEDRTSTINGAVFDLDKFAATWTSVLSDIKPGDTATSTPNPVDLGGLGIGRYRLTERKAPDGYIILSNYVYFEVYKDTDGVLKARLTDESGAAVTSPTDTAAIDGPGTGETPTYTVAVKNEPGVALPSTGGPGTRIFTLLGGMLIALAGALLLRKRRFL